LFVIQSENHYGNGPTHSTTGEQLAYFFFSIQNILKKGKEQERERHNKSERRHEMGSEEGEEEETRASWLMIALYNEYKMFSGREDSEIIVQKLNYFLSY